MQAHDQTILVVGGATASGKSAVSLELARRLGGEILCADSMQVYRGLDIATAKPDSRDRARVPHHGLDLVEVSDSFSVAAWLKVAEDTLSSMVQRRVVSLVVGGTGLYLRALLYGLDDHPPTDPFLLEQFSGLDTKELAAKLVALNPTRAADTDLLNRRRVERALALCLSETGSNQQTQSWQGVARPHRLFVLSREPDDLRERIRRRVDAMFEAGLLEEFSRARELGLGPGSTAWQALGYKEIQETLDRGGGEAPCRELIRARTWTYARRQQTWFRKERTAEWVLVKAHESPEAVADRIATLWTQGREGEFQT